MGQCLSRRWRLQHGSDVSADSDCSAADNTGISAVDYHLIWQFSYFSRMTGDVEKKCYLLGKFVCDAIDRQTYTERVSYGYVVNLW